MLRKFFHCGLVVSAVLLIANDVVAQQPLQSSNSSEASRRFSVADPTNPDWVRVGKTNYGWTWAAEHLDRDHDSAISLEESGMPGDAFKRIDRNWDGVLTAEDFQWTKESQLGRQKETAFALFKFADLDGNGKLSREEWSGLMEQFSEGKNTIDEEQLERMMFLPRVRKTAKEEKLRTANSQHSPAQLAAVPVPMPGDMAPDFQLSSPDGKFTMRLSQYRGEKPVVLVFGCYTCGNYRTYSEALEKMYQFWQDDVAFVRVYVSEAHPTSEAEAATSTNKRAGIVFQQPEDLQQRCNIATEFAKTLNVTTPMVVDQLDNKVGQAYGSWPDRLYIIDREGKVAYTGGPGPFGFNPREMEQSLAMLIIQQKLEAQKR